MRLQNTPGVHIAGAYSRVVVLTNARTKLTRWRRYGTTDIILGGVDGTSSITSNDFNRRGEYLLCTIYICYICIDIYMQILHTNITYVLYGAGTKVALMGARSTSKPPAVESGWMVG